MSLGQDMHRERLGLRHVLVGAYVYGVRRVNSSDLLMQGHASLEGSSAYSAKLEEHREAIRGIEAGLKDHRLSEEEKDEIRARLAQERERQSETLAQTLVGDPERAVAYMERCRAYVCAMVVEAGRVRPEVEAELAPVRGTCQIMRQDWDPSKICEDLSEEGEEGPAYLVPFRFVQDEEDSNPRDNVVWVRAFDNGEITSLGTVLMSLQEVASKVTATFREGSGVSS